MTRVLAVAPIGVPAYRMEAELLCRDLGSEIHLAVERLRGAGAELPEIAALLGVRSAQVDAVAAQLDGTGGLRARTLRVWVDPMHGAVLSHARGLDLVPHANRHHIPWLTVLPPGADELPTERFTRAASTRDEQRERIVVERVMRLRQDVRTAGSRRRRDEGDHLLLLPGTALVVRAGADGPELEVQWDGLLDEPLTELARATLPDAGLRPELLTEAEAGTARARLLAAIRADPDEAFALPLDPQPLQTQLLHEIARAEEQLVIVCDAQQRDWPIPLREALEGAQGRGVPYVERDGDGDGAAPAPAGTGLVLVRDRVRAMVHSDAVPFGGGWSVDALASQACVAVHEPQAAERLLDLLDVPPPAVARRRPPREPLEDLAARALRDALERLRRELPDMRVTLEHEDEEAFREHVERDPMNLDDPGRVEGLARGIAWERVLATACSALAAEHEQLEVEAMRRQPVGGNVDLDVIVRNAEHRVWWVLDAKCKVEATPWDARKVRRQLKVARQERWIPDGFEARGALVYPAFTRDVRETTIDPRVVGWRLSQLEERLTETPPPLG